jgi:DNA-binding CsgD family transcriptional regulator
MEAAWVALRGADWAAARDEFLEWLEDHPDDPEALDGLGRALWWLGQPREGIKRRREAYALYNRRGEKLEAANLATYLAAEHRIAGDSAAANGWLARAERLLDGAPPCSERGWLEVERAKRCAGRPSEHALHAEAAVGLARELNDWDLEAAALAQLGLARVDAGDVDGGLLLLDEAMTAATGGEASDPLAIGDACCTTLVACDRLADFARASEWCRAVVEFTGRRGFTPLHLWCRTVYARVLTATGDWERAERELVWALNGYEQLGSGSRVFALARLAELRVRQGRLGEAQTLLDGYDDHPLTLGACVTLALARGELELGCSLASRRLESARGNDSALASVLPLCAEAHLATADVESASAVAKQLFELGDRLHRPDLTALADLIAGRVEVCGGAAERAKPHLERALEAFRELEMPLEEGGTRLELARIESRELALLHGRAAVALFERLGARHDADAAAAVLRGLGVSGRGAPRIDGELTAREREVLALLAEVLSNQQIADRLVISPKTAEHHVGRILGKLGLRSRAEAASYVLRAPARNG